MKVFGVIVLVAAVVSCSQVASSFVTAAQEVLQRVIPNDYQKFHLVASTAPILNPQFAGRLPGMTNDTFEVAASGGVVTVTASSGVALCSGVYWYLKNVANCQMTWGNEGTGDQLHLPSNLPDVESTTVSATVPWRYAWNVCTFSYSATWWDWKRWQREIDWMAMHGINLPLAITATEYVWVKVFEQYNVTVSQLQSWFSGPAFLTWQRMGNIQGFGGPLSEAWINGQRDLQRNILQQARSLGMTTVLPCFAGHVPAVAKELFPNAKITRSSGWNGFPENFTDVWYLDPTDDLYRVLGGKFIDVLVAEFGTDHYYNCDTFNEVDPTSTDLGYLKNASAAVHNAIVSGDPGGIWVMQAWLFHSGYWNHNDTRVEAYLSGVENDKMVILDLNSESELLAPRYKQYFGKPWVWNLLHNYGGVRGMYGNLSDVASSPWDNLVLENSTMLGIGFTPEAIEQNPVMYEMLTSTFWSNGPIDVPSWLQAYVVQRYGVASGSPLVAAWNSLLLAVYSQAGEARSEIEWVPHWQNPNFGWLNGNPTAYFAAFQQFLAAANNVTNASSNGPLQYDLVDVTRQAATMFFNDLHRQFVNEMWATYYSPGINVTGSIQVIGVRILAIIEILDELLGTNVNYLLGWWTDTAMAWGSTPEEKALWLYNAKNQVTLWGPTGEICDYAAKAWSGLYSTYYFARWEILISEALAGLANKKPWNHNTYEAKVLSFEESWNAASTPFPFNTSGGSALDIAAKVLALISNPIASSFTVLNDTDIQGHDLIYTPTWTRDVTQLAALCNLMENCAGFNSNGYLKTGRTIIERKGSTSYLKLASTTATTPANNGDTHSRSEVPTEKSGFRYSLQRKRLFT